MESIKIESLTIDQVKEMLFKGKILNAASIVALYRSIELHEKNMRKKSFND
jgi:hypothetical protein